MALKARETSYYDDYEHRTFFKVETLERWTADCKKRRERYLGKTLKTWSGEHPIVDVVFTEPGLIGWVVYQDGNELHKIAEHQAQIV